MAVVGVKERGESRGGRESQQGQSNYTRVFVIRTNSRQDGPLTARAGVDPVTGTYVPVVGEIYVSGNEIDVTSRCTSVVTRQIDGEAGLTWESTVDYSSTFDSQQNTEDPLARPTEISFSFVQDKRAVWEDINGTAIMNSARLYFDPPIEVDDSRPIITMVRNEAVFNYSLALDYQDAVNSDVFFGFPVRSCKVANISAHSEFANGVEYARVTYEFHLRRDLWIPYKVLDAGQVDINGKTELSNRTPVTGPWPLTQTSSSSSNIGTFLAVGFAISAVKQKEFTLYKEKSFAPLNLP